METFEVGIIGAGVHGASAAYHLAMTGVHPLIIDRGAPAGGPTGRSSAVCRAYYTNQTLARVARDSLAMLRSFSELTSGRDAGFRETGFLFLHPADHVAQLKSVARDLNALGTSVQLVSPEELRADYPLIKPEDVAMAAWEPGAGYADPVATTQGLFERAVDLGAHPRLHSNVVRIVALPAGGVRLELQDGSLFECRRLLIAAGPWTASLAAMVGVIMPLTVERHIVVTLRWSRAKDLPYGHADLINNYYCKPEGGDLYCLGPLDPGEPVEPDAVVGSVRADEASSMAEAVTMRVPTMDDARIHGGWASLYDVSPDWQPVVGEIGPGIFVDAGTSGHGFKLAPAWGRLVANLVLGQQSTPDLAEFHPDRFKAGRSIASGYGAAKILG